MLIFRGDAQGKHALATEFADKAHKIKVAAEKAVLLLVLNSKPEPRTPNPEPRNPKPETPTPKPKTLSAVEPARGSDLAPQRPHHPKP